MRTMLLIVLLLAGCATPFVHLNNPYNAVVRVEVGGGHGSGVVVAQGVLTAAHVVEGGDEYTLHTNGGTYTTTDITIMGEGGTATDWALLDIETDIEPAEVYCGPLKVGQPVVHVGNPAIGATFIRVATYGRISSLDVGDDIAMFKNTVAVDISGDGGSSGGPMYDMQGRVVGLFVGVGRHHYGSMWSALMTRLPPEIC